jgi:glycerol-3-phosphate acyltransferase PlsY
MKYLIYIFIAVVSYLMGSFSLSIFMSKRMAGGDVRKHGSGNAGATNMARVYGMMAGVITMLADMAKAVVAMLLGLWLAGDVGLAIGGAGSILGHCFPVLHHFKGGKGVSVGGALSLLIDWRVGLLVIGVFIIVAVLSKKVSLGSICGGIMCGLGSVLLGVSTPRMLLGLLAMVVVVARHWENIKRLVKGTEPDFKPAKKTKLENQ